MNKTLESELRIRLAIALYERDNRVRLDEALIDYLIKGRLSDDIITVTLPLELLINQMAPNQPTAPSPPLPIKEKEKEKPVTEDEKVAVVAEAVTITKEEEVAPKAPANKLLAKLEDIEAGIIELPKEVDAETRRIITLSYKRFTGSKITDLADDFKTLCAIFADDDFEAIDSSPRYTKLKEIIMELK